VNTAYKALPGFQHRRQIGLFIEEAAVNAPGQAVAIKACAAGFRHRVTGRVQQAGMPESVRLLNGNQTGGHLFVQLDIFGPVRVILRHVFQHPGQAAKYPAIAPRPENLLAIGFAFGKIIVVAEIQMFVFVIKIVSRCPPFLIHEVDVAGVSGDRAKLRPDRRRHKQGIAPPPAILAFLLAGFERYIRRIGQDVIKPVFHPLEHLRFFIQVVQFQIHPADTMVVGMIDALMRLPIQFLAGVFEPFHVFGIFGHHRPGGKA